ncbi:unnamed protein product [Victoria cruziana]
MDDIMLCSIGVKKIQSITLQFSSSAMIISAIAFWRLSASSRRPEKRGLPVPSYSHPCCGLCCGTPIFEQSTECFDPPMEEMHTGEPINLETGFRVSGQCSID